MRTPMTLVYLYGPPAVGKLTVGTALRDQTGFRLFDNHLTVDAIRPVFDVASEPFTEVIHRLRLDVFETAAAHGVDLIFTNNSVWRVENGNERFRAFVAETQRRVAGAGGRVVLVQLTAPRDVLVERVDAESRRQRGKLVRAERLDELLVQLDPSPVAGTDLVIDTSTVDPGGAAALIAQQIR